MWATVRGIIVRSRGWRRVDLGSRLLEQEIVATLRERSWIVGSPSRAVSLRAMRRAQALCPVAPIGGQDLQPQGAMRIERGSERWIVARADDDAAAVALDAAGTAVVVYAGSSTAVCVAHDPPNGSCAWCALLLDQQLQALARPRGLRDDLDAAEREGWHIDAGAFPLARAVAETTSGGARWPAPGWARIYTELDQHRDVAVATHPACRCRAVRPKSGTVRLKSGTEQRTFGPGDAARRMTPIAVAQSGGDRLTRMRFRRSRDPWPLDREDWGSATASGEEAEVRALGEAVERFCMLHAPPDFIARGVDHAHVVLPRAQLAELLFRQEERDTPGFRHPPYDAHGTRAWSTAVAWMGHNRVLIPTSLIGRGGRDDTPLVDATSNGYAAHTDRLTAETSAVLEVVERDALLLCWYLGCPAPAIALQDEMAVPSGVARIQALLATQDIDLPLVWLLAELDDGSIRSAAAAAGCFETALDRAERELRAGLAKAPPRRRTAYAWHEASARHRPTDHLCHYLDAANGAPVRAWLAGKPTVTCDTLRARWPADTHVTLRERVHLALQRAGVQPWLVDRSLPALFGEGWHVIRAILPGTIELSWGRPYRRLAGHRVKRLLAAGHEVSEWPHPIA